jgi:hypothetical protein
MKNLGTPIDRLSLLFEGKISSKRNYVNKSCPVQRLGVFDLNLYFFKATSGEELFSGVLTRTELRDISRLREVPFNNFTPMISPTMRFWSLC